MYKLAIATSSEYPDLTAGDKSLIEPLAQRDCRALPVVWNDPDITWSSFDSVLIRSTWDYHLHPEAFRAWLFKLAQQRVQIWNPAPVILWNMDKIYLRELHANGVHSLPIVWVNKGDKTTLKTQLRERNWEKVVIKPRISASAYQTFVISHDEAEQHEEKFREVLQRTDVILQKFAKEISSGEWSFMFFNGIYSHAVLKRPAEGNIFVQSELGGTAHHEEPPAHLIAQAAQILRVARKILKLPILYARVDCVVVDEALRLMELELIEPYLFLEQSKIVSERFADAIIDAIEFHEQK